MCVPQQFQPPDHDIKIRDGDCVGESRQHFHNGAWWQFSQIYDWDPMNISYYILSCHIILFVTPMYIPSRISVPRKVPPYFMLVIIIHTSGIYVEYNRSIYLIIFVISQTYRTYPHSFPHMLVTFLHKSGTRYIIIQLSLSILSGIIIRLIQCGAQL